MVNPLSELRKQFRFTTGRYMEPAYYQQSLLKSSYFRNNTITMACALIAGIITAVRYWKAIPFISELFLLTSLACLIGVWVRTIIDHGRIRKRLCESPPELGPNEMLKVAAGGANSGPSAMYIVALILIFSLAFTIAHCEALLSAALRTSAH